MIDAAIGRTTLVRLQKVVEPEMAEVWMKMEGANPDGSIKGRTALGMITDAEERGVLRPGRTIVEPTSGNTGLGFQGMGPGFVPDNFDRSVVDRIVTAWEEDAFPLARRLAREAGLFVGCRTGRSPSSRCRSRESWARASACISPDSGTRYLTTALFATD